eukprot:gb/GEZN01004841.1/.p1 GENE.gb/GEZN01004841.1/~~gb/GEZN01004841.1/.p1  ORF type:complete len:521 (-),score=89.60 gb/GEZN01004841.1/:330-1694(-)
MWARSSTDTKKITLDISKATVGDAISASAEALGVNENAGPWICSQYLQDVIRLTGQESSVRATDALATVGIKEGATLYVALSTSQVPSPLPAAAASRTETTGAPVEVSAIAKLAEVVASDVGSPIILSDKEFAKTLTEDNVIQQLQEAKGSHRQVALEYLDKVSSNILAPDDKDSKALSRLTAIPKPLLQELLKRDTLGIKEADLFVGVMNWGKANSKADKPDELKTFMKDILPFIRFPIMASKDIAHKVLPSQMLEVSQTVELFTYIGATEAGVDAKLGSSIVHWSAVKRKPPVSDLVFDKSSDSPLTISEDGLEVSHTGSNGAVYCLNPITEGKWRWTVDVLAAKGNCMTIGVATKKDPKGSGRSTGLHASGNCLDLQMGCGKSGGSFRVKRLTNGVKVTVTLDMTSREMGFEVDGEKSGMVVKDLPDTVYPAVDMREKGLKVRLGEIEPIL